MEKGMNRVYSSMNRVCGSWRIGSTDNLLMRAAQWAIYDPDQIIKGVFWASNRNHRSKFGQLWLDRWGGSVAGGGMLCSWLVIWGTNLGMAWLYGIAGAWGIRLTNLGEALISVDSRRRGPRLVNLWLQDLDRKLAGVHLLLPGRYNGSKWRRKIEFDGYLGFGAFLNLRAKIWAQSTGIYRGFGTYAQKIRYPN
jgi:hypothetical protein